MISMPGFVNKQGQTAHTVERQRQKAKIKKSRKKQKKRNTPTNIINKIWFIVIKLYKTVIIHIKIVKIMPSV